MAYFTVFCAESSVVKAIDNNHYFTLYDEIGEAIGVYLDLSHLITFAAQ